MLAQAENSSTRLVAVCRQDAQGELAHWRSSRWLPHCKSTICLRGSSISSQSQNNKTQAEAHELHGENIALDSKGVPY